jgi:hypothetical protein
MYNRRPSLRISSAIDPHLLLLILVYFVFLSIVVILIAFQLFALSFIG